MQKKYIILIITIFVVLIGSLIIFGDNRIKTVNINNISNVLKKNEYTLIYIGNKTEESDDYLNSFKELGNIKIYYTNMKIQDFNEKFDLELEEDDVYVVFSYDTYIGSMKDNETLTRYTELINKYLYNKIPESEIKYIVPKDVDEYIKLLKSKNYTISVFGKDDCYYCSLFLPTINEIAEEYKIDIYYLDQDLYDKEGYQKIMDLDYVIPASCTTKNIETSFKKGFAKPTTIITKNNKIVGCIKGNVTKETVINKLNEFKLLEG